MITSFMKVCPYIILFLLIPFSIAAQSNDKAQLQARIVVVGDGGVLHQGEHPVSKAVSRHVSKQDRNTTILFVGDNIYTYGLPDEEEANHEEKKQVIFKQLEPLFDHQASVYVIPGNHDWANGQRVGWGNIKRQGKYVNGLQSNIHFAPLDGCPGPVEIALGDSVILVLMDTQWWLHENDKPDVSSDCDCKTEAELMVALNDIAYRNAYKKVVFAAHHPLKTYGIHGGYYTWKQHIFPVSDMVPNAYVPLPVLGSIYPITRGKFGNIQDVIHPVYKDMIAAIELAMQDVKDLTYVAGHEHNLQLIKDKRRHYVVSGSGSKTARVKEGKGTLFAAEKVGFTEIEYFSNGTQTITFYEVDKEGNQTQLHKQVIQAPSKRLGNNSIVKPPPHDDSVTVAIAPEYDDVGGLHRLLFGEHYRKLWATPVKLKVFRINEEQGGLKVLKRGGGQQTKSLRLEDKNGKQWVLRTVQKDPEKALPSNLRGTVAKNVVQDQISAANPYAPLTIPTMAGTVGVPHANPVIMYVPDDTALGPYRKDFANTVCLFEEREPVKEGKTYSTFKVLDKLEEDNDNYIDEHAVLRARMFDLLIGDWDRHEDQWRWKKTEVGKKNIYAPIPRDRDQVYFINTGVIPYLAGRSWAQPKFQGFGERVKNVNGFMFNARHFDRRFLNTLSEDDWKVVIKGIQNSLTDEVIDEAIDHLPDTIYAQVGERIAHHLKERRDNLLEQGLKYYRFLSKSIEVPATDKKDKFTITYLTGGDVAISVQTAKKGDTLYYRRIDQDVTKEVRLYGRGGKDVFDVRGNEKSKVKVRMIGGGKNDAFFVGEYVPNGKRIYIYDRSDKSNTFPDKGQAKLKISDKNEVNDYNERSFKYNRVMPLVNAGYNFDDGLLLGGGVMVTRHGFRKEPHSSKHGIQIGRAFATEAGFLKYNGDMVDVLGKLDLNINFNLRAPDNTANFFGVGNQTQFLEVSSPVIRYYRTRYHFSDIDVVLKRNIAENSYFFGGLIGQYYKLGDGTDNIGRFILNYDVLNPEEQVRQEKWFAGVKTGFDIDTRNSKIIPVRGMRWVTTLTGLQQLNGDSRTFAQLQSEMSLLVSFSRRPKVIFANRFGVSTTFGDPYFFQLNYIGGQGSLQGYRKNRFAGHSSIYNNFELRVKLFDFNSYLFPGTFGLIGFNDVGRVWAKNQSSAKWHVGYGGGIFIIPAQTIVVSGVLGFSEEGLLPYVSLGFRF